MRDLNKSKRRVPNGPDYSKNVYLDAIFDHYYSVVVGTMRRYVGDRAKSRDLTQDYFLKLANQNIEKVMTTWAQGASYVSYGARLVALEYLRSDHRRRDLILPAVEGMDFPGVETEQQLWEYKVLTSSIQKRVIDKWDKVAGEIYLDLIQGAKPKEISQIYGISRGAARMKCSRIYRFVAEITETLEL